MTANDARPRFGSLADLRSSRITQVLVESQTRIIRGLFALAPRRRPARVRWVIAIALVAVVAMLANDPSVREYITTNAVDAYHAHTTPRASKASAVTPADTSVIEPSVSWPATSNVLVVRKTVGDAPTAPATSATAPATRPAAKPRAKGSRRGS